MPDFRLEDVWELPGGCGPGEFPALVSLITSQDPSRSRSFAVRALFAIRWNVGSLLGWDEVADDSHSHSLRDRLPADLRDTPLPAFDALPFTTLYLLEDEFAAEVANRTVHGVLHIGLVPDGGGRCRAQLAVLVKPNGILGSAYISAIRPFRHLIVYPAMMKETERAWRRRRATPILTGG